jgi:hypothetical protein
MCVSEVLHPNLKHVLIDFESAQIIRLNLYVKVVRHCAYTRKYEMSTERLEQEDGVLAFEANSLLGTHYGNSMQGGIPVILWLLT